jgi:hypothetical protein
VHRPAVSQKILEILMEDGGSEKSLSKAWDEIIESLVLG